MARGIINPAEMDLLPRGTIFRFFQKFPKVTRKPFMGHPRFCIHFHEVEDPDSLEPTVIRCTKRVAPGCPNGFLCGEHQALMSTKRVPPKRNVDQETIDSITKTETKALAGVQREIVRLTAKGLKMQFVAGVRLKRELDEVVPLEELDQIDDQEVTIQ